MSVERKVEAGLFKRIMIKWSVSQPQLCMTKAAVLSVKRVRELYELDWCTRTLRVMKRRRALYRKAGVVEVEAYCLRDINDALGLRQTVPPS